jgi:hypothetical protein
MNRPVVPLVLALLAAPPAIATVDLFGSSVTCAGTTFNPSDTYPLFRGRTVVLSLVGFSVDTAKEVQLSSLPGVQATILSRLHGIGSRLDIELAVDAGASLGTGEIRLRYDVEVAGFDKVRAQVFDFPRVDSMSIEAAPGVARPDEIKDSVPAYVLVPGSDYTLILGGQKLLDLRPRSPIERQGHFTNVSVLSASDGELKVRLRPVLPGTTTIRTGNFKIEKLRCVESPSGSASVQISIAVPPTPTPTIAKTTSPHSPRP